MASEASKISKKNKPKFIVSTKCACCSEDVSRGVPSARGRLILSGRSGANYAQQSTLCAVSQDMATFFELFPHKEILICVACSHTLCRIFRMQEKLRNMATDLAREVSVIQNGVKPFVKQFLPLRVKRTTNRSPAAKSDDSQSIQLKIPLKETKELFIGGNDPNEKHQHPVQADPVPVKKKKLDQEIKNIAENSYVKIKPRPTEPVTVPMRVVGFIQKQWKAPESSGSSNDGDGSSGVPETLSGRTVEETGQGESVETGASRVSDQSEQVEVPSNLNEIRPEHVKSTALSLSCLSETLHSRAPNEPVENESIDMVISRVSGKTHQEEVVSNYIKMETESEKCATLPSVSDVKQMTDHVSLEIPHKTDEGSIMNQEK